MNELQDETHLKSYLWSAHIDLLILCYMEIIYAFDVAYVSDLDARLVFMQI